MQVNGSFRKKASFTIAGNTLVRDAKVSLKSKGLYLLIQSYITFDAPGFYLTKERLQGYCTEGEKAFNSAWCELKDKGYLKVHLTPRTSGYHSEYELLDAPQEGAHTFYHSSNGEVTNTNLTLSRSPRTKLSDEKHTPQKGTYADGGDTEGSNADGMYAQGNNANGGDNLKLSRKTKDNIFYKTQSITQHECAG